SSPIAQVCHASAAERDPALIPQREEPRVGYAALSPTGVIRNDVVEPSNRIAEAKSIPLRRRRKACLRSKVALTLPRASTFHVSIWAMRPSIHSLNKIRTRDNNFSAAKRDVSSKVAISSNDRPCSYLQTTACADRSGSSCLQSANALR